MPKKSPAAIIRPPQPPLMCATAGCPYEARIRRRVDARWMNLCCACDDRHMRSENQAWCIEHGYETVEKQKDYCKSIIAKWPGRKWQSYKIAGPG